MKDKIFPSAPLANNHGRAFHTNTHYTLYYVSY